MNMGSFCLCVYTGQALMQNFVKGGGQGEDNFGPNVKKRTS